MLESRLDKDLIPDTSLYTMLIRVSAMGVDVVIYSPMVDNSLIYRSFTRPEADSCGVGDDSGHSLLEDVVYDNPLMLSDFRSVTILTDTPRWVLFPLELAETDPMAPRRVFSALSSSPDVEGECADTSMYNAAIIYATDPQLARFVRRTFPTARIKPHILPLLRYFASRPGRGNSPRMLVNLRPGQADIITAAGNRLIQAVTATFSATADLIYRILAMVRDSGLDPNNDEILISGSQSIREEISPMLRTYHSRVMPVIFPPEMFRSGRDAVNAPFDLIISPLC